MRGHTRLTNLSPAINASIVAPLQGHYGATNATNILMNDLTNVNSAISLSKLPRSEIRIRKDIRRKKHFIVTFVL